MEPSWNMTGSRKRQRERAVVWNTATFGETAAFAITKTCSTAGCGLKLVDCKITCIKQLLFFFQSCAVTEICYWLIKKDTTTVVCCGWFLGCCYVVSKAFSVLLLFFFLFFFWNMFSRLILPGQMVAGWHQSKEPSLYDILV